MMQQAIDFRVESEALYQLLDSLSESDFDQPTQFKGWTFNNVLGHLHVWNWAADLSLKSGEEFQEFLGNLSTEMQASNLNGAETLWLKGKKGRELLQIWRDFYLEMSDRFKEADPKQRLKWAGPDMSARSSITARLMETWAHGQEAYDTLGVKRINADHIKNVAVLGVNTFGWTYVNRGMQTPEQMPYLDLSAPSGENWQWGDNNSDNSVVGKAEEFCQVVTQVRNIKDTSLQVKGIIAEQWMSFAQCFAGGPEDPPAPGTRFTGPA